MIIEMTTEQDAVAQSDAALKPLGQALSTDGAKRGPLWIAYHNLILFSRWGERLPTVEKDLKQTLKIEDPARYSFFTDMLQAYGDLKTTSENFNTKVFLQIGKLTGDLRQFAIDAKIGDGGSFDAVLECLDGDIPDAMEVMRELQATAAANAKRANGVNEALAQFATDVNQAEKALQLVQQQVDADSRTSQARIDLIEGGEDTPGSIKNFQKIAAEQDKEYHHDVVVASTSPSYAWVCPFGTIAAGVVAGVYGARATAALRAYKATMTTLEAEQKELAIALHVRNAQQLAATGLAKAKEHCEMAMRETTVVQQAWGTISDDLDYIMDKVNKMTTADGTHMKSKTLVKLFVRNSGKRWEELMPMIEELTSAAEGTTDLQTLDADQMADRIEAATNQ